jgi:hypothetical protein
MLLRKWFEPAQTEVQMQMALSHPGSPHWLMPILLGIIVPLLFVALPGEPLQIVAKDAGLVKHVRTQIAMLHAVRARFQQMREAEQDVLSGRSNAAREFAIFDVRRSLDKMAATASSANGLREAIEAYARTFAHEVTTERYGEPTTEARLVSAPANAIELVLGQLQTSDEARLREPLLAMRLAEAALRSGRDPRSADQLSRWAGIFAARLDEMVIPQGTRANLMGRLAAYEHAVLDLPDALPRQQIDPEGTASAARAVETALANADRALTAEQRHLNETFEAACEEFVWTFAASLGAALLIVGGGVFGRRAFDHGVTLTWRAR